MGQRPHAVQRLPYAVLGERHSLGVFVLGAAASHADRHREPGERLLGTVVEVPLEPPALCVGRGDDRRACGAQALEVGSLLGLQALMVDGQARCATQLLDESGIVEQSGPCE